MSSRVGQISSHLQKPNTVGSHHPDDVVIVSALRTPITRARKGGFKDTVKLFDFAILVVLLFCFIFREVET